MDAPHTTQFTPDPADHRSGVRCDAGEGVSLFAAYDKDAIATAMESNLDPVCDALGLVKHGPRYHCWKCGSKTAFSTESGGARCHKCGWTGDGFSLIMAVCNLSFPDALQYAADVYSYGPLTTPKPKQKKPLPSVKLDIGTDAEIQQLAYLRKVSVAAIDISLADGLLRFGCFDGHRCWIITDSTGRNMQARRLDGKPLTASGREIKAKTLPGSQASWPIGITEAQAYPCIVLVEGGPDVLAAFHFIVEQGMQTHVAVVGMMGAANRIPDDALMLFAGKRVRIIPDADQAGRDAAGRWYSQLVKTGATVDCFSLEGLAGVKDLNDVTSMTPNAFSNEPALSQMFFDMVEGGSI